jgi:ribosomal protein S18 acetylase RimI-like enzyme
VEVRFRDIQPAIDRDTILEFHCFNNYQSESPVYRSIPYEEYQKSWLKSPQPEEVLLTMAKDLDDSRNIVQFVTIDGKIAGFLWVRFEDFNMTLLGIKKTHAVIYGLSVKDEYQRKGIGLKILTYIEQEARRKGATLIRSGTGTENTASLRLHEAYGFKVYYVEYEKDL